MFGSLFERPIFRPAPALIARYLRRTATMLLLAGLVAAAPAGGAPICPSNDPNENYNCPIGPAYVLPGWANVSWSLPKNFETIQTGDVDGDGKADLVGRDARGLHLFMFNTATGIWQPVLTTDGNAELVLAGLSDSAGWSAPQYYRTIKLVKLDAGPLKLVMRAATGLLVYQFDKGPTSPFGFPTGSWRQVSAGGPFADADGWNNAPYYETLRYGVIGEGTNTSVIGWNKNELATFTWTGSGWAAQTSTPGFGDPADQKDAALSVQLTAVDATAKAKLVYLNGIGGLTAYEFVAGTGWQFLGGDEQQLFFGCDQTTRSCAYTLQPATLDTSGAPTLIGRTVGCTHGGMIGYKFETTTRKWIQTFADGPFNDCAPGFAKPENFRSIQAADIDGDGIDELIGRGPDGIVVYRWNNAAKTWSPMVTNVPALSDTLWAADPSYWQTIRTAKIDGSKAALLARGASGIRTWLYNGSTFASPQPYGKFPALDATSYAAINTFLNLPNGVRALYADPTRDEKSVTLSGTSNQLIAAGKGCSNEVSADPPQYVICDALAGTSNPAYTNTVNQLIRELWYGGNVIDHFTTLQTMQASFFTTQSSTLPAIDANLQIAEAKNQSTAWNYIKLFDGILSLVGKIPGLGGVAVAAESLGLVISGQPLFQQPQQASALEQQYADVVATVASLQGAAQTLNLANKHHVLSDYVLLAAVGQLVGSSVWVLDEAGYLSVARQGFTTWVMQALLPTVWEEFQVTGCEFGQGLQCTPPPNGASMQSYSGLNFTGILPKQTPCQETCGGLLGCNTACGWTTLSDGAARLVFAPVSSACTYTPGTGNAWNYPAPGQQPGCSLGAGTAIFTASEGWKFQVDQIGLANSPVTISGVSAANNLNDPMLPPQLRLQILGPLSAPVDLGTAQLQVSRLFREIGGAEELVKGSAGSDFFPLTLSPQQVTSGRAVFETPPGQTPRISAVVQSKPGRAVNFDISIEGALMIDPELCVGTLPAKARLHVLVQLSGGGLSQPATFAQVADWECVTDAQGALRMLRPAGHPAWSLGFGP